MTMLPGPEDAALLAHVRGLRDEMNRLLAEYRFGMREVETKLSILRDDFEQAHAYNPVEHLSCRLKSPDSIAEKAVRKGIEPDLETIRSEITDIAGVRVTCSFVSDVYRLFELLVGQDDISVREVKDYIARPKASGYQSLHVIVEVPVFLSTGTVRVPVEVQFRTIAMDFWASLEHKIYYKYDKQVPTHLTDSLRDAAVTAAELDARMENLHREIQGVRDERPPIAPMRVQEGDGLSRA